MEEAYIKKVKCFLNELSELTRKHGIKICGCGCCGSPWIEDIRTGNMVDNLEYNDEKQQYEVWIDRWE